MRAELIDFVYSKIIPKQDIPLIEPCVRFTKVRWAQGRYRKEKVSEDACAIDGRGGKFLTGLIPRIENYCRAQGIPFEYDRPEPLRASSDPILPGIIFREDQNRLLQEVAKHQRGIIKSPTGSGKTCLAGAICSMWPKSNILFLCHTIDLLTQSYDEFIKWGLEGPIMLGGKSKQAFNWDAGRNIVVATLQTFINYDLASHSDYFDIIILDECHHLSKSKNQSSQIFNQSLAPIRIGLTATPPDEKERKEVLTLEGFIGPIIGEFTREEAIKAGIIARPIINLIPVPFYEEIADLRIPDDPTDPKTLDHAPSYRDFYQKGIIENRARNRLILTEAYKSIQIGESVLILIATVVDHGLILQDMARDIFNLEIPFVYGETKKDIRKQMIQDLEDKKILCLIANVIFKEGINIRSLNHVINAAAQAKERATLQRIGRGQRATDTKKTVKITDFLDPYKHLSYHCVLRMTTYASEGWLTYG